MYGSSNSMPAAMNGIGGDLVDSTGTINPAALDNTVAITTNALSPTTDTAPRGVKRSRSPEQPHEESAEADYEENQSQTPGPRKRGRPPKIARTTVPSENNAPGTPVRTVRMQSQTLPQSTNVSPVQTSPSEKTTPSKASVKALPTVRDHTTDQLNEEKDEYIPREFDEAGEQKVDYLGYLQGGREYRLRTFTVPLRGKKLFMLATECARVLGYRDSYLLFNKNRSLHKIIASQIEKDDLIQQDILPYSYRSRQIAIVTAKSMFRQFGSRVIVNGHRVRDDYWESKARKQGFTEDDLAGEKRPGATKARDAAAAEAASASMIQNFAHGDVIYSNALEDLPQGLALGPPSSSLTAVPPIHLATTTDDPRLREYASIARSRQELTGQPYQDRSQPSNATDIMNQASQTAEFNKLLGTQRSLRQKGLDEFFAKQREIPATLAQSQAEQLDTTTAVSHALASPQLSSAGVINQTQPQGILVDQPQMMPVQASFPPQTSPSLISQSPVRAMRTTMRPDFLPQRTQNPAMPAGVPPAAAYGYPPQAQQIWAHQTQSSPLSVSGTQAVGLSQYSPQVQTQSQHSPFPIGPGPHSQQHHPSQSPSSHQNRVQPHQMPQSYQLHATAPQQSMASMGFAGANPSAYSSLAHTRMMYPHAQGGPGGQQFISASPQQQGLTMGMVAGVGMAGWPSVPTGQIPPSGHPQQPGQSGSPLGGWSGY